MKKLFILVLVMGIGTVRAQVNREFREKSFLNFFRMKQTVMDPKWIKSAPQLTTVSSDQSSSAFIYWQGTTYTSYSVNGRFRSSYSFDVQGILRESRASFSLKKSGVLSYWRVQFSPQRSRPFFTYTIH